MDSSRFDGLTRRFATRRAAFGLLAGVAALGVETSDARRRRGKMTRSRPVKCVPNRVCAKWCASTFGEDTPEAGACTSAANKCRGACWTCGAGCADAGTCSQALCSGACATLDTDPNNCGDCGNVCAGGGACEKGACLPGCQQPSADSTYALTCREISQACTAEGSILTATCERADGETWLKTSITIDSCASEEYEISNCDGTLTCGGCG
jgi:hypothetical protein